MAVVIPINAQFSNFVEDVTLDGVTYKFRFLFNNRFKQWSFSVLDINQVPLVEGIKLVLGYSLFDQYPGRNLPPGILSVIDVTETQDAIDRDNFGLTAELLYMTEAEVDAI